MPTQDLSTTIKADQPIEIGIPYAKNSGAALAALGGNSSTATDQSTMYKAVIADANRHGGIAGHRIVPVFFGIDVTGDQQAQSQSACAAFTQDNKVFAALGIGSADYYGCLQRAGVMVVTEPVGDAVTQRRWPLQVSPNDMLLDRVARTYLSGLRVGGYLSGKPRIGILSYSDNDSYARVTNQILLPGLRQVDPATMVQAVPQAQSAGDLASQQSAVSNAVLKFNMAGVTRVVFFVDGGLPESSFAKDAESQRYRPRYAFSSLDDVQSTIEGGLFSGATSQLEHSVGVGWQPVFDTAYPSPFMSTTPAQRCLAIARSAGISISSSVSAGQLTQACDGIWFLQTTGAKASHVSASALVSAARTLGTAFTSAATQRTLFQGNLDGAAGYQLQTFDTACSCIKSTSPVREAVR